MTELEIMQHAKGYLDKLAKGIDPLTDQEVPEDDVINNVRISRCLFYVSDVLRQVIENGGVIGAPAKKGELAPYALPYEERSRYTFGEWPLSASQIAQRLNELVDLSAMQKLKTTSITKFLLQSGLLFEEEAPSGNKNKRTRTSDRQKPAGSWAFLRSSAAGKTEIIPPWSMIGRPSSSSWTIWTPSSRSTRLRCMKTRESPGKRRRTRICGRLFRRAPRSRTCPTRSSAPARPSARGLKSWD